MLIKSVLVFYKINSLCTVDFCYSEVGYSESLAIVNSFRPLVWFAIPDNVKSSAYSEVGYSESPVIVNAF